MFQFDIAYTNTLTQRQAHTADSGVNTLTHPYKCILTPPVICSQQLSVLHGMNNSLISKIYFPQCHFFSKSTPAKVKYLLIRFLSSSCETQIILIEMVQIIKKHTQKKKLRERQHWKGLVSLKISNIPPFLKQPRYFINLCLFMRKIWTPHFAKFLKTQQLPSPL